jgi:hypothetical protein
MLEIFSDHSVFLRQPVEAVVGLAHASDGSADGVGLVRSGHPAGGLIHIGEVDLD